LTRSIHTERYAEFRRLLIEARVNSGVTQAEMASTLGRPQSYVSKYEHGDRRLDVVEFIEVVDALDVDGAEILGKVRKVKGRSSRRK